MPTHFTTHENLKQFGDRIMLEARNELFLAMRFLGRALDSLPPEMDLSTRSIGTDARTLHYNPNFVFQLFLESPQKLDRLYLHSLLHCIFRHMFKSDDYANAALWDLACDIQVESVLDSMDVELLLRPAYPFREEWYERLKAECKVLTAERIYQYFSMNKPDLDTQQMLVMEFCKDDHQYWKRMEDEKGDQPNPEPPMPEEPNPSPGEGDEEGAMRESKAKVISEEDMDKLSEDWREHAERLETELETFGKEAADDLGSLRLVLSVQNRKEIDFRRFLEKLMVVREETHVDPDSFDYAYYNYGMEVYGNMPLIEENEFREERKIEDFVIAIDTSASTKDGKNRSQESLIQAFLNQTIAMLRNKRHFFERFNVHIITCDDRIQQDIRFSRMEEVEQYAEHFTLNGGYGTDFRPVFQYVEELRKSGELAHMRGLMYFTDGYGAYPEKMTVYDTAFVYPADADIDDMSAPDWALKLYLRSERRGPDERKGRTKE